MKLDGNGKWLNTNVRWLKTNRFSLNEKMLISQNNLKEVS